MSKEARGFLVLGSAARIMYIMMLNDQYSSTNLVMFDLFGHIARCAGLSYVCQDRQTYVIMLSFSQIFGWS